MRPDASRTPKGRIRVTRFQHATRMGLLMAVAAVLLGWVLRHKETSFADGLRYIHQAEKIQAATWRDGLVKGIDHPLHPLGIAAVHRVLGGTDPTSWQVAALVLCFTSAVLLVIPIYLLTPRAVWRKDRLAWLPAGDRQSDHWLYRGQHPLREHVLALVELWSVGIGPVSPRGPIPLAAAGDWVWGTGLPDASRGDALARGPGARPCWLLPLSRATRINWPRWWRAIAFLLAGVVLSGRTVHRCSKVEWEPSRASHACWDWRRGRDPLALEREKPLPPDQTDFDTYRIATIRMLKVFRAAVTPPLFPVRAARNCPGSALGSPRSSPCRLVPGDRAGRLGGCACAAACHRWLLHRPSRSRPRHHPDTGSRLWLDLVNGQGLDPGPLARPGPLSDCGLAPPSGRY